jgi:hypothetical protein
MYNSGGLDSASKTETNQINTAGSDTNKMAITFDVNSADKKD